MDFQLSLQSEAIGSAYPDEPLAATPTTPVRAAIALLGSQKTGAVLVCEDEKLVGIFTERDALKLMAQWAGNNDRTAGVAGTSPETPVSEVMHADLTTVQAEATVGETIQLMHEGGYRHMPIVDHCGKPTGTVAVRGVVHYLVEHFPNTVYNLPPKADQAPAEREGA